MNDGGTPQRLPPEHPDDALTISPPAESAGGLDAVKVALTIAVGQMGIARSASTLLDVNKADGFDCPGCAWPEPTRRSMVEFCENGAKAIAEEATSRRIGPEFFAARSIGELSRESDYWLSQQGRLTTPMHRAKDATHYTPISWDGAFQLVARHLRGLSSPNEAIFYTSGRTSNEAAFLYQLFVRMFGTNNLPDCSNMCHESSGVAMKESIGSGKGTVLLEDFDHADCILVIGQNPGTNHPRMLSALQAAARRGCRIISINPLHEAGLRRFKHPQDIVGLFGRGTKIASRHLGVRINGDVALLKGIQKVIIESHGECIDRRFIAERTDGFEAHCADLAGERWDRIEASSGIDEATIRTAAAEIAQSKAMICCWAMGVTQHRNAVANIQQITNLLLLGGHFGRRGAGACPVRGHSNVQGDRTMGIWERPSREFLDALAAEFTFSPPRDHGLSTIEAIEAMYSGHARVFLAMGGNFLSATPDTNYTATALDRCTLTAHISTKLNRSHLVTGEEALILPCLGRTERDSQHGIEQIVTVENSMGVVHASRGRLEPGSADLRSEVAIVGGLAKAVLGIDWGHFASNYDLIRDRIARVVPGFEGFNARIHRDAAFTLPHPVRDHLKFETSSGRAQFMTHPIPDELVGAGELLLTTIRSHDQFNTTIYGLDDRYRGVRGGRRVIFMNVDDLRERSLAARDVVDIVSSGKASRTTEAGASPLRRARNFRVVPYEIPRGCCAAYFPETNVLVPISEFAAGSLTPASKSVVVRIEKP
ncbi:MAG: FdhF/YdeP family oxidoreductase [Phycisphaerales bacterium]|nr:FdhF/YdeP family oxidoreductase [Phycisphaerales bacterium]